MLRMRSAYENAYAGAGFKTADTVLNSQMQSEKTALANQGIHITQADLKDLAEKAKQGSKHP